MWIMSSVEEGLGGRGGGGGGGGGGWVGRKNWLVFFLLPFLLPFLVREIQVNANNNTVAMYREGRRRGTPASLEESSQSLESLK